MAAKMRGGLFHASISDPAGGIARRKPLLRSIFDHIDTNKSGTIDRDELVQYVRWASTEDGDIDPVHHRICALFQEGGSLDRSFDR